MYERTAAPHAGPPCARGARKAAGSAGRAATARRGTRGRARRSARGRRRRARGPGSPRDDDARWGAWESTVTLTCPAGGLSRSGDRDHAGATPGLGTRLSDRNEGEVQLPFAGCARPAQGGAPAWAALRGGPERQSVARANRRRLPYTTRNHAVARHRAAPFNGTSM